MHALACGSELRKHTFHHRPFKALVFARAARRIWPEFFSTDHLKWEKVVLSL